MKDEKSLSVADCVFQVIGHVGKGPATTTTMAVCSTTSFLIHQC